VLDEQRILLLLLLLRTIATMMDTAMNRMIEVEAKMLFLEDYR
jgi:hypothetical protein